MSNTVKDVKVSVVIPVYNVEEYVSECLESVVNQTLKEIEIICVDDASTDNSLTIIREYEKKDSRVKVIAYTDNKSASQARKDGALQARGEYVIFLDGDDYLELDTCEKLYHVITEKQVDMVHFGTNVINAGNLPEKRIENLEKILAPYDGELVGEDVFEGCFVDKKYRFSIWNKIYSAKLCKEAFNFVKDGEFPKAQDLYAFFILCYHAKSYCGIEERYYNYRFGTGITGNKHLTLPQLERYCSSLWVAEAIQEFIVEKNEERYMDVVAEIRKSLLNDCVGQWYTAVSDEDSEKGFDILCKYWDSVEIVSNLCEKHYFERKKIAEKVVGAEAIKCSVDKEIKTVGIFYHRYAIGGVQRVISCLIPMYMEMGYKVVLFTDEISEEDEYELPDGAVRVVLPSSLTIKKEEYVFRAQEFVKYLKEYNVDVLCYQAASSTKLIFDMLLLKLNNIPVIITIHEVCFQNMLTMNLDMVDRPSLYKIADYVTVLSRVEEMYWRGLGINAVYVPNPITNQITSRNLAEIEENTIVWVGRLDTRTKRCLDVVDIMKYVVEEIPNAKLLVVGNEVTAGIMEQMKRKIETMEVEKNVILCGHSVDVDAYYRQAEIYMLTSISESFSMTIAESKAYGLPLVMYDMPFLEFCRDKKGFLSAPQGDKKKMAENIVRILRDKELKCKLQQEAQESLKSFLEYDLKQAWDNIFSGLRSVSDEHVENETLGILLKSMLQHYNYGTTINNNEKRVLRKKVDVLSKKVKKMKKSSKIKRTWDYRIGHAILCIPRKFVRGIRKLVKKFFK